MKVRIALIAFGGNAILPENQKGLQEEQMHQAQKAAELMVQIIKKGYELIVVHGNGPQVGNLLIQMEEAANKIPPFSLDVCDAMTEGSMGFMLEKAIINELRRQSIDKDVATIITQVVVDKDDPAFEKPTKPIGPFYPKFRAQQLSRQKKWTMVEDAGRGWRRVVASPIPVRIVEAEAIHKLVAAGFTVVGVGGGGIPVIEQENGDLIGVEAVIDKDFGSSVLATLIKADLFIISTAVEKVAINFNKPDQKWLDRITVAEAKQYITEGHFAKGSMLPKIQAILRFMEAGGKAALITNPENISRALKGETGTWIVP